MRKLLLTFALCLTTTVAFAGDLIPLSFRGAASLRDIQAGKLTETVRLGDRGAAPFEYKVNMLLPLVNSEEREDSRPFPEQVAANAYGKVLINAMNVAQFNSLNATEQADVLKFYTREKIAEAKGIVSILRFTFVK